MLIPLQGGSFLSLELLLVVALSVVPTVIGLVFVIRDKRKQDEKEE